jgi:hypothetical protein
MPWKTSLRQLVIIAKNMQLTIILSVRGVIDRNLHFEFVAMCMPDTSSHYGHAMAMRGQFGLHEQHPIPL